MTKQIAFPGYIYDMGKSTYRDEEVGEGGYVYAEPGMYENVALLDVASMHPASIEVLDLFGKYTENFSALKSARLAIKHRDYDAASKMLDGKLAPFLIDREEVYDIAKASQLAYALKIVINIVYGLTSAKFDNAFRDHRNIDNIVAKRGALFMIDLKHFVQEQGFTVAHIKTDSIKIPNANSEIVDAVIEFGKKYGYDFEHEATYDKMCLVNDAVYIAHYAHGSTEEQGRWVAVGAQFQHPYVFKSLFTKEDITFEDMCETKQVTQGVMYLDFEIDRPTFMLDGLTFVGRTGRFVPVEADSGGGILYRVKEDKHYAVTGTKGYLWMEATVAKHMLETTGINIDVAYFDKLVREAVRAIEKYGSFDDFVA